MGSVLSKTQRKRAMHELQALGEMLVELAPERLAWLQLPPKLAKALKEAKRVTSFEARRRQLQYIGRLLEPYDGEKLKRLIKALAPGGELERAWRLEAERCVRRFLEQEEELGALRMRFPEIDLGRCRWLRRVALDEAAVGASEPLNTQGARRLIAEFTQSLAANASLTLPLRNEESYE